MKMTSKSQLLVSITLVLVILTSAQAWDPNNGDWLKSDATDLRVMTWNVQDGICSTNNKVEGFNNWTALARIVASMQPDVLILQEMGDNDGNGTGSGGDSVADLLTTVDLFFHGGSDPFLGGTVTAYVQAYAPAYDLPNVFVSAFTDNYNRNVIVSRYPFGDLNGDTKSQLHDIPFLLPDEYAPGGNGGIRGFQFAEIELPVGSYPGDLVIGNAHLKAGGSSSDLAARLLASQNVAYVIDYWYNGADSGVPDPHDKIIDNPPATTILSADTPVIIGGDWNEDELTNGRKGPAEWLTMAEFAGGSDGTDRDRSDMTYDSAVHFFTGERRTQGSGSGSTNKLDYLAWQDSIGTLRRAFLFNSFGTPVGSLPPELSGFPYPAGTSGTASDHRPVIVDIVVSTIVPDCYVGADCDDGDCCTDDICNAGICENPTYIYGDLNRDGDANLNDLLCLLDGLSGMCLSTCDPQTCDNLDIEPFNDPVCGNGDINLIDLLAELDVLRGVPAECL